MPDIWLDVDAAVTVPANLLPLIDPTDFKTIEDNTIAYNAAGIEVIWHFVTCAGVMTSTPITPTTGGNYDWTHSDGGVYKIEIPASGGASANNNTEGTGWITGKADACLAFRGPTIGFRRAPLNDLLVEGSTASTNLEDFFDGTGYAGGTARLDVDIMSIYGSEPFALKWYGLLNAMPSGSVVDDNNPDPTTTAFEISIGSVNDQYNGAFILFTAGALAGQSRLISDFNVTTAVLTVATAFSEAPVAGDTFIILGRSE